MKKITMLVYTIFLISCIQAHFLSFLLPVHSPTQLQKLLEQDTQKALRVRLAIGFIGGFCSTAFCARYVPAISIGGAATAGTSYWINTYTPIITQERQLLDITNAYVVGVLTGILARKAAQKIIKNFNEIFNKPEARVTVTECLHKE